MINFTSNLTQKDLSVLIALQENPLATYDWLSERVGLVKSIVFGIIKKLTAGPIPHFTVTARVNHWVLGLENVDILVEADNKEKVEKIEKLCFEFPYTFYRARSFGDTNGLLMQFALPKDNISKLNNLLKVLQKKEMIDEFSILPFASSKSIFSTPNVDFWNPNIQKWVFDWDEWFEADVKKTDLKPFEGEFGEVKKWITRQDIAILKELVRDARRKNLDIISVLEKEGYEYTPQTFSRKLKRIKDECISEYRVFLNPAVFDLYTTVLIRGKGTKKALSNLQSKMIEIPIPFSSTFKIADDNIYWYLHLPPTHLSDLLFHLRQHLVDLRFNYIDYVRAKTYLPWPETFDEEKHDWRTDDEFLIESVMKALSK